MWKEDPTADFFEDEYSEYSGILGLKETVKKRYYFASKWGQAAVPTHRDKWCGDRDGYGRFLTEEQMTRLEEETHKLPVPIFKKGEWSWWMFQRHFFRENDARVYTREEAKAIILQKLRRSQKQVEWAVAQVNHEDIDDDGANRPPIPDQVKLRVWQRDRGKCVRCGGNRSLEFDHIIPVSQGGGNTERNLQLLCESCNRSKGGRLV